MSTATLTSPPKPPTHHLPVTASPEAHRSFRVVGTEHDETYDDFLIATERDARQAFQWVHPSDPIHSVTELIRRA